MAQVTLKYFTNQSYACQVDVFQMLILTIQLRLLSQILLNMHDNVKTRFTKSTLQQPQ